MNHSSFHWRLIWFFLIVAIITFGYIALSNKGWLDFLADGTAVRQWVRELGAWGPVSIIGLMTLAIVMSPIPSAPIALAAGAVYGHYEGTIYVAIGSETGAIIAFLTSRLLGADALKEKVDNHYLQRFLDSQNALMAIVFISRLLPFISFDMISYAAGLTPLNFWRFAIATFAGILPASFVLAHFGSELASNENQRIGLTILLLGLIPALLILGKWFSKRLRT